MSAYFRALKDVALLDRDQERELARQLKKTGDRRVEQRLVEAHLRLVVRMAAEFHSDAISFADLVQEGNLGLLEAVRHYDPERGVRLSSYAAWWIRAYIMRAIVNNARLVRVGTTDAQRRVFFNLKRTEAALTADGLDASSDAVAARLGVTSRQARETIDRLHAPEVALDAPVRGDGRELLGDRFASSGADPETQVAEAELEARLHERLVDFRARLEQRDRELFDARWSDEQQETLSNFGARHRISRERVRQLEQRLLDRLRAEVGPLLSPAKTRRRRGRPARAERLELGLGLAAPR
jgi:RNA polymerase sigma-32 factor